jgi:hypothetical protein
MQDLPAIKKRIKKLLPPRKTHRVWQKRRANMVWLYIQYTYIYICIHITYIYIHIIYIYIFYRRICVCVMFFPPKWGAHLRLGNIDCRFWIVDSGTNNLSPTWIRSTTLGKNREKHIWLVVEPPLWKIW